jgi:ABC-type nitrate/sulfonate/bicarbonate transport system permease component
VLALWEANVQLGVYRVLAPALPPTFFPSLSAIFHDAVASLSLREYRAAVAISTARTLAAFSVGTILGILLALVGARSKRIGDLIHYPAEFLRQLPAVAVIPLAIILFGIYTPMKVAVAVFGCVFPVYVAAREGLRSVDAGLMFTARTYGWTGPRLLFGVMLPSAFPHIFGASKIALAIALILVIMAEMLVGGDGLGIRLVEHERTFDFAKLYAETLLLGLLGVLLNQALELVGRRLHYWRDDATWQPSPAATANTLTR